MRRRVIRATEVEIEGRRYRVEYFEQLTVRGSSRFSCEVMLDDTDRIIVDDDSLTGVESKVARLVPAMVYSRLLAGRASVAA